MMRTSPSDFLKWPDICRLAAENDRVFENFKRNPSYHWVLEHVSAAEGRGYLKAALSQNPDLLRWFDKFRENDKYGNPYTFDYGTYGKFSPTTLRYIKVLSDLKCLFNDLNGFNIIEIGGGYGGQCKIIADIYKVKSYTIVDLPPAIQLTKKYLKRNHVDNVNYLENSALQTNLQSDLVISNYAFSELMKASQDIYLERVISNSQRGYVSCNYPINGVYLKTELLEKIKCKTIEIGPLVSKENVIMVWDYEDILGFDKRYNAVLKILLNFSNRIEWLRILNPKIVLACKYPKLYLFYKSIKKAVSKYLLKASFIV